MFPPVLDEINVTRNPTILMEATRNCNYINDGVLAELYIDEYEWNIPAILMALLFIGGLVLAVRVFRKRFYFKL